MTRRRSAVGMFAASFLPTSLWAWWTVRRARRDRAHWHRVWGL